jgi:hypothetical protein
MAEALAVIGLVSSIGQFVDFGIKVLNRINEFKSDIDEVPKTFRDVKSKLPLLIDILNRTKAQTEAHHVSESTAKALLPVVQSCELEVQRLNDIITKVIPVGSITSLSRHWMAIKSLSKDQTVQDIVSSLDGSIRILTYHQSTRSAELTQSLVLRPVASPSIEQTKLPSKKSYFMIPFDRDPDFIGRDDVFEEIERRIITGQRRIALTGMGGVG